MVGEGRPSTFCFGACKDRLTTGRSTTPLPSCPDLFRASTSLRRLARARPAPRCRKAWMPGTSPLLSGLTSVDPVQGVGTGGFPALPPDRERIAAHPPPPSFSPCCHPGLDPGSRATGTAFARLPWTPDQVPWALTCCPGRGRVPSKHGPAGPPLCHPGLERGSRATGVALAQLPRIPVRGDSFGSRPPGNPRRSVAMDRSIAALPFPVMVGGGRPSTSFSLSANNKKQNVDGRPSPTMTPRGRVRFRPRGRPETWRGKTS